MKRLLAGCLVFVVMGSVARADEASKRAKVEELVIVMHMDKLNDQMMSAVKLQVEHMSQSAPGTDTLTPAQKKVMADFEQRSLKLVSDSMGWQTMKADFVKLYVQNFTEAEIDGMVAFYKSPSGQAVLTKMPQLMTASMQLVQERMVSLQPQLKTLQDQFLQQMEAAGSSTAPAKATPKT